MADTPGRGGTRARPRPALVPEPRLAGETAGGPWDWGDPVSGRLDQRSGQTSLVEALHLSLVSVLQIEFPLIKH